MDNEITSKDYEALGRANTAVTTLETVCSVLRSTLDRANCCESHSTLQAQISQLYITAKTVTAAANEVNAALTEAIDAAFEDLPKVTDNNEQI